MSTKKDLLDLTIFLNCMSFTTYRLLNDVLEGNIMKFGEDFIKTLTKSIRTAASESSHHTPGGKTLLNQEMAGSIITVSTFGITDSGRNICISNSFASIVETIAKIKHGY